MSATMDEWLEEKHAAEATAALEADVQTGPGWVQRGIADETIIAGLNACRTLREIAEENCVGENTVSNRVTYLVKAGKLPADTRGDFKANGFKHVSVGGHKRKVLLDALSAGCTVTAACALARLSQSTYRRWLTDDEEYAAEVAHAEATAEAYCTGVIIEAVMKRDVKAAIWWLERRRPKDWSPRGRVELSAAPPDETPTPALSNGHGEPED